MVITFSWLWPSVSQRRRAIKYRLLCRVFIIRTEIAQAFKLHLVAHLGFG